MIVDDEQQDPARGFDPRYDPAFQRGYRPQPGERARTRLRAAPAAAADRAADRAVRPAEQPAPAEVAPLSIVPPPAERLTDESLIPPALPASPAPTPTEAAPATVASASILDGLELSPRRNPLMLTLWLVAAGFVVLGIVLYCVSVSMSYTGASPTSDVGSLVVSQLGWMLAGPLITIGLATLVALLFLSALAGRRRSEPTPGPAPEDEGY